MWYVIFPIGRATATSRVGGCGDPAQCPWGSRQRLGSSPAPAQQRVTVRQEDGRSRTHGDLLVLQLLRVASVVGFLRQSTPVAVEPSAVLAHPKVLQLLSKPPAHPSAHVVPVDSPLGELLPPQQSMPSKMDRLCLRDESQDRIPFWNPPSRPPPPLMSCSGSVWWRARGCATGGWGIHHAST